MWDPPADTARTVRPVPTLVVDREEPISLPPSPMELVLPTPSCPDELRPQHFTVLVPVTTQVCDPPAATARAWVEVPILTVDVEDATSLSTSPMVLVLPRPSCPDVLRPQHFTTEVTEVAQVWLPPGLTWSMPR